MTKVIEFNNIEDAFRHIEEGNKQADASVKDWQRTIKPGDLCVRFYDVGDAIIPIICEVLEIDEELRENYVWANCYSEITPYGEAGSVHVSVFDGRVSREEFEVLQKANFKIDLGVV